MKPYLISLAVGLLIGAIYGLLNVKSPAPPMIALVGLLGILLGEQAVPVARRMLAGQPAATRTASTKSPDEMPVAKSAPLPPRDGA